jgi:WD40 repeat protein
MSQQTDATHPGDSADVLSWIDTIADRFEAAWQQGPPPKIADFLGAEAGERRSALLEELVKIDLAYHWQAGDRRDLADYRADFPDLFGPDGTPPDGLAQHARQLRGCWRGEARPEATCVAPAAGDGTGSFAFRCPQCGHAPDARQAVCPNCGSFQVDPGPGALFRPEDLPRPLGKFQLLALLGCGSFGAVYRARDTELGRVVAVKVPRAGRFSSAEEQERFLREARSAAGLRHPGVVAVHEIAHAGGLPCIVCEYVEGRTLAQQLAERRLGFREAAELAAQVAEALDYAHRHGIVHRDVNPRNILLDSAGRPHVADFGLARRDEGSVVVTLDGQILGTPAYMAPEQAAGEQTRVDGRSDVYSLGVTLYQLLAGELPFRGSIRMLLHQVLHDEPRPPRRLNDRIPRDLETVCLKAMAKEPARRYPSAGELAADLGRYLKGEPIRARPVGPLERGWRWCRRNPVVAGLTAAVAATLLTGMGVSWYFALKADANARNERRQRELAQRREYAANMNRIQSHWEAGHVSQALALLQEQQPDLRGWEWHHQERLAHADLLTLLHSHTYLDGVDSVAFSPDGQLLASASRSVKLWDPVSGRELATLQGQHPTAVARLAFSPDGKRLASANRGARHAQGGCDPMVAVLWDVTTGQPLHTLTIHTGGDASVALSPDGTRLASAGSDNIVRVWDIAGDRVLVTLPGHTGEVHTNGLAFSPDGTRLASASEDTTVKVWDVIRGQELLTIRGHAARVGTVAFSPDGRQLASGGTDHTARIWDAATGRPVHTLQGHTSQVNSVAFSPNGTWLASADNDGTLRVWDVTSGDLLHTRRGHENAVQVAFSPDGQRLASAGVDRTVRVWDVAGDYESRLLCRQTQPVGSVVFSPDSRQLATAGEDRTVRLWDMISGQERRVLRGHTRELWCVAFSPDGGRLASADAAGTIRVWDTAGGQPLQTLTGHTSQAFSVAFHPDGRRLASASRDGTVRVWDAARGRELRSLEGHPEGGRKASVHGVAFSPDGRWLASAGDDKNVRVWDVETGQERLTLRGHTKWVYCVAFSPDGQRLASGSDDNTVKVWDAGSGQLLCTLTSHTQPVWTVAFSRDGRRLASAGVREVVKLWDPESFQEVYTLPAGAHFASVAFSPDGHWLASVNADRQVRLWDARPLTPDVREEREALGLVEFLFATPLPKADVLARIREHRTIGEGVRRSALAFAEGWREGPAFHDAAWRGVSRQGAAADRYRQALRWAETACRREPDEEGYRTALGLAQYRVGQYREALATLTRADQLHPDVPAHLAFLALTCKQLGEAARAREHLARLRKCLTVDATWATDEEAQRFLSEAEAGMEGRGGEP